MTLSFKGAVTSLPTEGVAVNDAYLLTGTGYKYCSSLSGTTPTWTTYIPVKVIDELALSKTYEGSGTPDDTTNAVQFPETLDMGTFYLDGATGSVYAYVTGSGWQAW